MESSKQGHLRNWRNRSPWTLILSVPKTLRLALKSQNRKKNGFTMKPSQLITYNYIQSFLFYEMFCVNIQQRHYQIKCVNLQTFPDKKSKHQKKSQVQFFYICPWTKNMAIKKSIFTVFFRNKVLYKSGNEWCMNKPLGTILREYRKE